MEEVNKATSSVKDINISETTTETNTETKDEGILDMVIAFDTTGSMSSYIGNVKNHIRELVPDLFKTNPNLQISVVAFGDYCDMESKDVFGKAYQCIGLTRNENEIIDFINNAQNTSGGDGDEFYELVLHKIVNETEWREKSKKSILLIADASPHPIGYTYNDYVVNNQIDWKEEAKNASSKSIQIDTLSLFYGSDSNNWYKELSQMTNGVYAPFTKSEDTDELIRASAWSRGGDYTKDLFNDTMCYYADASVCSLGSDDLKLSDYTASRVANSEVSSLKAVTSAKATTLNSTYMAFAKNCE